MRSVPYLNPKGTRADSSLTNPHCHWRSGADPQRSGEFRDLIVWPVGISAEKNEGVAALVQRTPNSIGYVEAIYAILHKLNFGSVRNTAGKFVKADIDSITASISTSSAPAGDFRSMLARSILQTFH